MKWNSSLFLENRLFDQRLVKENLIDKWNIYGDIYKTRTDYRQFVESNPWITTNNRLTSNTDAFNNDPINAVRSGMLYQTPHHHPLPLSNSLQEVKTTSQIMDTTFEPTDISREPLQFPNLVTDFNRNPEHAARSALYTRYTPAEWHKSCMTSYSETDFNIHLSEKLRNDAIRLMRQTEEKTVTGQREVGRRLGERLNELKFWRNELSIELEKVISEYSLLADIKRRTTKALEDLDSPLKVAEECLYFRENRHGIDKVHDVVEKSLLAEVKNVKISQEKLRQCLDQINKALSDLRATQHSLEEDIIYKENTLGIDTICHNLTNYSQGINYYGGIEKYDPTVSTIEQWTQATNARINKSHTVRATSAQIRISAEALINSINSSVWNHWNDTNNALNARSSEMCEAKNGMQLHLHKTQQEIFDIERNIDLLRKAIEDKAKPLKVAQTRLEARGHRAGIEQCKDFAYVQLVQEIGEIQNSVTVLHRKLQEAEERHQQLLKVKSNLECNLRKKVNSLFIDREKCMGIRRCFPVDCLIKY